MRVGFFCALLHGSVAISKRTLWGKLRMSKSRSTSATEVLLETIRDSSPMPFFGEQALYAGMAAGDGVSHASVRAVEQTCLICLNAAGVASCARAYTNCAAHAHVTPCDALALLPRPASMRLRS